MCTTYCLEDIVLRFPALRHAYGTCTTVPKMQPNTRFWSLDFAVVGRSGAVHELGHMVSPSIMAEVFTMDGVYERRVIIRLPRCDLLIASHRVSKVATRLCNGCFSFRMLQDVATQAFNDASKETISLQSLSSTSRHAYHHIPVHSPTSHRPPTTPPPHLFTIPIHFPPHRTHRQLLPLPHSYLTQFIPPCDKSLANKVPLPASQSHRARVRSPGTLKYAG